VFVKIVPEKDKIKIVSASKGVKTLQKNKRQRNYNLFKVKFIQLEAIKS
jgi:hypothetical protein